MKVKTNETTIKADDIKTINARFEDAIAKRAAERAALETKKEEYRSKLKEASEILETTDDPNKYAEAVAAIAEAKKGIDFCNARIEKKEDVISESDYKAGLKDIDESLDAYLEINRARLIEAIENVIDVYSEVYDNTREYLNARCTLCTLAKDNEEAYRRFYFDVEMKRTNELTGDAEKVFELLEKLRSFNVSVNLIKAGATPANANFFPKNKGGYYMPHN